MGETHRRPAPASHRDKVTVLVEAGEPESAHPAALEE
jgi:hypothetical protein